MSFLLFQPRNRTLAVTSSMCSFKMEYPLLNLVAVPIMFWMQLQARTSTITDGCQWLSGMKCFSYFHLYFLTFSFPHHHCCPGLSSYLNIFNLCFFNQRKTRQIALMNIDVCVGSADTLSSNGLSALWRSEPKTNDQNTRNACHRNLSRCTFGCLNGGSLHLKYISSQRYEISGRQDSLCSV